MRLLLMWGLAIGVSTAANAAVLQGPVVNPGNGHTYYLLAPYETGVNSWNAIRAEAASLGGDLTSIQDAAEDNWIYTTFGPTALAAEPASDIKSLLIGMNDISAPWSWVDGAPTTYTNWVPTEPHSAIGDGEDYGGILLNFGNPENGMTFALNRATSCTASSNLSPNHRHGHLPFLAWG